MQTLVAVILFLFVVLVPIHVCRIIDHYLSPKNNGFGKEDLFIQWSSGFFAILFAFVVLTVIVAVCKLLWLFAGVITGVLV